MSRRQLFSISDAGLKTLNRRATIRRHPLCTISFARTTFGFAPGGVSCLASRIPYPGGSQDPQEQKRRGRPPRACVAEPTLHAPGPGREWQSAGGAPLRPRCPGLFCLSWGEDNCPQCRTFSHSHSHSRSHSHQSCTHAHPPTHRPPSQVWLRTSFARTRLASHQFCTHQFWFCTRGCLLASRLGRHVLVCLTPKKKMWIANRRVQARI